jgi:nucleoside-diphosphate-sugar epimerase
VSLGPGHPLHKSFYRDAVKGVHAIVHSPTVPSLDNPLEDVWSLSAASVTCLLEAAERERGVAAVVYTSSMVAATPLVTPRSVEVTDDSWNIKDTMRAVTNPRSGGNHVVLNSALARAEQELWEWYEEQRPNFKVNVVSPSNIIGQVPGIEHTTDGRNWLWRLYRYGRAGEVIPGAGPTQARMFRSILILTSSMTHIHPRIRPISC